MSEAYGFRLTSDIAALIMVVFGFLYLINADGPNAFKQSRCAKDKEKHVFDPDLIIPLNRSRNVSYHSHSHSHDINVRLRTHS